MHAMQLRSTPNIVKLGFSDESTGRVLVVTVNARMRMANLVDIVKKQLNISDFALKHQKNIQFDELHKNSQLSELFEIESLPPGVRTAPNFTVLPDSSVDWARIPVTNRLTIQLMDSFAALKEQDQPNLTADETSSNAIGLHEMIDEDSFFGSSNNCTAIVPFGPPHATADSVASSTQTGDVSSASRNTNGTGFAGLVNSGMTCYMNSLLQTLYMTPEFRNALYCWRFQGTEAEAVTSIPYQLQKLFVQLYATTQTAVSTSGVTTSFGWRTSDVFQQQDIHELCRVMFDALEKKLGTGNPNQVPTRACPSFDNSSIHAPTHDLINRLYQGERSDCVRCTVCNRVSCRPDTFLDIQVPLRPFELNAEPYDSLETAFRALIKPERLDGSNQYYCSRCQTKRDAERVAAFHRMPYLLTLQLMRFTFDLTTMNRIKINDRFTFPLDRWDLSEFITPAPQDLASDEESLDECGTEDGTDYLETENEYEVASGAASSNGRLTSDRNVHRVEDEFEEMDLGNGDSGVNSSTTDSPYDGAFSGSPTGESSNNEEHMLDCTPLNSENRTITASLPAGLAFERAVASAVHKHPGLNGIQTDHSVDTDEDDGFGTGDARSACSSTTNSSSTNGHHLKSAKAGKLGNLPQARTRHKSNSNRWQGVDEPTPTKDRKPLARELLNHSNQDQPSSVYELFSIMVHSGFINGGHYFAYIKSFTDNQWYCFNDKTVSRANLADLEETFGSKQSYTSRANAYFLMYRRVDPDVNEQFLPPEKFPEHIVEMLEAVRQEEAESQRKLELELSVCKFEAYAYCPTTQQTVQAVVSLYKDQTMAEAADIVRQALLPDCTSLRSPHCRLVQYTASTNSFGKSAEYALWHRPANGTETAGNENPSQIHQQTDCALQSATVCTQEPSAVNTDAASLVTVGEFAENKRFYPFKLWLEHRLNIPGAIVANGQNARVQWKAYEPKGITVHLSRVDVGQRLVYPPLMLWFSPTATVADLMSETWSLFTGQPPSFSPNSTINDGCHRPVWSSNFQLIADQSCQGSREHSIQQGFPEWTFLLSAGVDHNTRLSSLFTESISDLSTSYSYQKCVPARVYLDLGPEFDDLFGQSANDPGDGSEDRSSTDSDAKRGRWQSGLSDSHENSRLHQLTTIVDESLFVIDVPLQYPSQDQIDLALLQWQLLHSDPVPMDLDDCMSTSLPVTASEEKHAGDCNALSPNQSSPTTWSDVLVKHNNCGQHLSATASNVSSTDSGCSVAAHYGSPGRSLSPFDYPRPMSRRRTNSQSHLDQLKIDDQRMQRRSLSSSYTNLPRQGGDESGTAMFMGETVGPCGSNGHCTSKCSHSSRLCVFEPASLNSEPAASTCDGTQSIRVRLDKRLTVDQFKRSLASHLNLQLDHVKMQVLVNHCNLAGDFKQVGPTDTILVTLESAVDAEVKKLSLRVLDLVGLKPSSNAPHSNQSSSRLSPVWEDRVSLFCRANWTVDRILSSVSELLRMMHHLVLPTSRLRLRKCGSIEPTPGPLLGPHDVLSNFYNPHQGLMVQLMPEEQDMSDYHTHSDKTMSTHSPTLLSMVSPGFVFVRRWYPSTVSFGPHWHEVKIPPSADRATRWEVLVSWIATQSGLPVDRLSVARCNFPGISHVWNMEASLNNSGSLTWHSCAAYSVLSSPVPNNGQVVYYKDSTETCPGPIPVDPVGPSNLQKTHVTQSKNDIPSVPADPVWSYGPHLPSTSNTLTTSSSHGNMYSLGASRYDYEQPLRIYTAEDAIPSTSSSLQPPNLRPSLQTSKPRESRTP